MIWKVSKISILIATMAVVITGIAIAISGSNPDLIDAKGRLLRDLALPIAALSGTMAAGKGAKNIASAMKKNEGDSKWHSGPPAS